MQHNNDQLSEKDKESISEAVSNVRDLQSLLRKSYGDELSLVDCSIDCLVPLGENFGSNMLKISTKVRRTKKSPIEELNFVAKTIVVYDFPIDWTNILKKEIFMYTDIIPFYKMMELENGIHENETIAEHFPILCGHRMSLEEGNSKADKDAMILLDNLKVKGYFIMDKKVGLNRQYSILAIKTLARFHALGIVAKTKYAEKFQPIRSQVQHPGFDYHILDEMYDKLVDMMVENPMFDKYIDRIKVIVARMKGTWPGKMSQHELWATIIHNDFWTNNMMFHRDETGKVDGFKIVDFQTYCFANVFTDLGYFLFTSMNEDLMLNHLDEMLDIYYSTFISTIERMNGSTKGYSREEFDRQFKKDAGNEILHCALALKFFTYDVDDNTNTNRGTLVTELIAYKGNDLYFKKLDQLLKIYEDRDWIH